MYVQNYMYVHVLVQIQVHMYMYMQWHPVQPTSCDVAHGLCPAFDVGCCLHSHCPVLWHDVTGLPVLLAKMSHTTSAVVERAAISSPDIVLMNYSLSVAVCTLQGVYPPLPRRGGHTIGGISHPLPHLLTFLPSFFLPPSSLLPSSLKKHHSLPRGAGFTMLAAAGPFSTTDSLDMKPLHDLLRVVGEEQPSVLLLVRWRMEGEREGGGKEKQGRGRRGAGMKEILSAV